MQRADEINFSQDQILEKGKNELQKVKKKKGYILSEIKKGEENGYEPVREGENRIEFKKGKNSPEMYMLEISEENSKLIRKTKFDSYNGNIKYVEEYSKKDGTNRYDFASFDDNFVLTISKGISRKNGAKQAKKVYSYGSDGTLKRYVKDQKTDTFGNEFKSEHYYFARGILAYAAFDQTHSKNGDDGVGEDYSFVEGELFSCRKNVLRNSKGKLEKGETFLFKNDELKHYSRVQNQTGLEDNSEEHFDFDNGLLYRYYNNSGVIEL